ncbi:hypothetical protein ALC60_06353 [Trachymyrmex zeteki]|uniref:Uncharacterized protein n=1 Tax=Mycetomoellerius zeteki TaxID=64791 RepID=A0A151X2W0_9HYME|nr:hypothetical protein ALC60_06353 [Trachymyrmex zeteki]
MPADLVRRKVEQGSVLVGNVLVLVSQIYLRTIVASHLSHSIVALHSLAASQQSDITKIFSLPYDLKETNVLLLFCLGTDIASIWGILGYVHVS